jgi:tryptophanyl-tRNA synthetase
MGWGTFKPLLAEATVEALSPIQERYRALRSDPGYLESVLKAGQLKASGVAQTTLQTVRTALGFLEAS